VLLLSRGFGRGEELSKGVLVDREKRGGRERERPARRKGYRGRRWDVGTLPKEREKFKGGHSGES